RVLRRRWESIGSNRPAGVFRLVVGQELVWPLCAGQIVKRTAGKRDGYGSACLQGLAIHEIPPAGDLVENSVLCEFPSLAERKLGDENSHKAVRYVVIRATFLQGAVVERHAAAATIAVNIVDGFRERVKPIDEEAVRHPLFGAKRHAMVRVVSVI